MTRFCAFTVFFSNSSTDWLWKRAKGNDYWDWMWHKMEREDYDD